MGRGGINRWRWASDTWNRDRDLNLQGWTLTFNPMGPGLLDLGDLGSLGRDLDLDLGMVHTSSAGRCQGSVWQLEFAAGSVCVG
jgi:hypothetical protein